MCNDDKVIAVCHDCQRQMTARETPLFAPEDGRTLCFPCLDEYALSMEELAAHARNVMRDAFALPVGGRMEVKDKLVTFDELQRAFTKYGLFDVVDKGESDYTDSPDSQYRWVWLDDELEAGGVREPRCFIIHTERDGRLVVTHDDWL